MIYQRQKVIDIVPAAITPDIYIFFNPDYVRQPKGILDSNQGESLSSFCVVRQGKNHEFV
jgi:hypothetical protein